MRSLKLSDSNVEIICGSDNFIICCICGDESITKKYFVPKLSRETSILQVYILQDIVKRGRKNSGL